MEEFAKLVDSYSTALDTVLKSNNELKLATEKLAHARNEVLKVLGPKDSNTCPVCMERSRVRALLCGHCYCNTCCARIIREGRCPTCRTVAHRSIRVYI